MVGSPPKLSVFYSQLWTSAPSKGSLRLLRTESADFKATFCPRPFPVSRKDALHCGGGGGGAFSFCRSSCRCGHAQLVSFSCSYSIDNEERGKVLFSREGNLGRPASLKCWHASATPPVSISLSLFVRHSFAALLLSQAT